ncbi:MAG: hypothetical protein Q9188_005718 [Gyalolechia gomerana]
MARTGRTPRAMKSREGNWVNPGVVGRATGTTVPPLGPRDEYGMEPISGLFSSPAKSPPKRNGVQPNPTIDGDEDETMNIGSSTIPEPTEVMKARNGKSVLPPPRSRSPIKTNLGSAARRSLGPLSSPSRHAEPPQDTPTHRAMSHPPNRKLDFSMNESYSSTRTSASKSKLPAKASKLKPTPISGKRKRDPFDLEPEAEEELLGGDTRLSNGTAPAENAYDEDLNYGGVDESLNLANGGGPSQLADTQAAQAQDIISPSVEKDTTTTLTKVKGKRGKTVASKLAQAETIKATPGSGRRGRPAKKPKTSVPAEEPVEEPFEEAIEGPSEGPIEGPVEEPVEEPIEESIEEPVQEDPEPRKRRGRAPKAAMEPPKSKPGRAKGALSLKDPNMKLKPTRPRRASSISTRGSMSPSKARFVKRSETPGDELQFKTRAGRPSMKPLAYWRGESAVLGGGRVEEGQLILPTIKNVIRCDELPEPRRRRTPGQPRRRRPTRPAELDDIPEDEEDEAEYWETEAGVMQASVMLWDPETGRGDDENKEMADVAYAADAIEMRDISGADFRFAKTLTLPFFGSGMVDLPPGGTKRIKNSRKMQMVFFVFYGRVTVELGTPTTHFSIGRGGMWQVPRGNFYAITNSSQKPARIFFAQGCEVAPDSAAFDESGAT